MRYDLLDVETGNLLGRFSAEDEALAFVRDLIEANGAEIAESLVLGGRDGADGVLPVETGAALARRAGAKVSVPLAGHA